MKIPRYTIPRVARCADGAMTRSPSPVRALVHIALAVTILVGAAWVFLGGDQPGPARVVVVTPSPTPYPGGWTPGGDR